MCIGGRHLPFTYLPYKWQKLVYTQGFTTVSHVGGKSPRTCNICRFLAQYMAPGSQRDQPGLEWRPNKGWQCFSLQCSLLVLRLAFTTTAISFQRLASWVSGTTLSPYFNSPYSVQLPQSILVNHTHLLSHPYHTLIR